jgi:hypothetical protein
MRQKMARALMTTPETDGRKEEGVKNVRFWGSHRVTVTGGAGFL